MTSLTPSLFRSPKVAPSLQNWSSSWMRVKVWSSWAEAAAVTDMTRTNRVAEIGLFIRRPSKGNGRKSRKIGVARLCKTCDPIGYGHGALRNHRALARDRVRGHYISVSGRNATCCFDRAPECEIRLRRQRTMLLTTRALLVSLSLCVVAASGCGGGGGATPTSPSASGGSGDAFAGTVSGAAATAPAGMTVAVVGTSLSATVEATGNFQVDSVPSGNVQLQFRNGSMNATAQISNVANDEFVQIQVQLDWFVCEHRQRSPFRRKSVAVSPYRRAARISRSTSASTRSRRTGRTAMPRLASLCPATRPRCSTRTAGRRELPSASGSSTNGPGRQRGAGTQHHRRQPGRLERTRSATPAPFR